MTARLGTLIASTRARLDEGGFRRLAHSLDRGVSLARTFKRRFLAAADGGPLGAAHAYIIFPSSPEGRPPVPFEGCALTLAERVRELAVALCGGRVRLLCADAQTGRLRTFEDGRAVPTSELFSEHPTILLANTSFLLNPEPPVAALLQAAVDGAFAVCAADSSRSLYAVAVTRQAAAQAEFELAVRHLAASVEMPGTPRWAGHPHAKLVPMPCGNIENSPAAKGPKHPISRRSPIAPVYLNAALAELFYDPADTGPADNSLERSRQAFLAQRERSSVPWIFNTLVNEIEYRLGLPVLDSLPPEVHLSLTGRCNIECKFCHYAHERAYSDYVSVERIAALDALRYSHTLRLSSGIGEPTINPHLAAIVEYVAGRFPQIQMNFFTNGTALNRRGLTDALVYNTAWINVSLNAATRSTWQELCEKDMFERLCSNLKELHRAKRERGAVQPVVYGSMVLTARNVHDLPRMPELCRTLGIDRFTGIPFFSLGYDYADRYGAAETFHRCREVYDRLYEETLREAQTHRVSIELPMPAIRKQITFGLETRAFYDFAGTEEPPGRLNALVGDAQWPPAESDNCHHIWRAAYIGSTDRSHVLPNAHYLYPCLGPLARVDFSTRTTFDFPDTQGFRQIWNSPTLVKLRAAQTRAGLSKVCDACRRTDTRDPESFEQMQELLKDWREGDTAPLVQLTRDRPFV